MLTFLGLTLARMWLSAIVSCRLMEANLLSNLLADLEILSDVSLDYTARRFKVSHQSRSIE